MNKNNREINGISLKAPAKINLFLEILGKRDDGYHEIETVMQEIDLVDNLQFEEIREGVKLKCNNKNIPSDENNLVCKAANLMVNECGIKKGVLISLEKNIPVGAGLGGGSSDAATTLKALNSLWKIGLSDVDLVEFAARLGSDIPFFIKGKTALCSGRGEKITPIEVKSEMNYLVIFPHINISTATIYRNLKIDLTKKRKDVSFFLNALKNSKVADISKLLFNRLEEVIFATYPDLLHVKSSLEHFDFCGLSVSGSGSAFFGLCNDRRQAEAIKGKVELSGIGSVFAVTNVITP
ncbi:MAG: 4-(cytidine 5'-diphospho)-2-C-methyl-D-erythritol kinase [Planctomycetes bacterium GWF2_40_8]|nr:MAG: 4-(cytidine 5'-diphospho)-2-C-methyl-D-erythritol kinase [Planctomycetes bacterium GWF2_40_8]OHB87062.1 MAG: 4-(cytidine 5'-diphospho)-2-C-methyl-D-erythritol kinase [Planctomycetes bacterium RIFCSPHIGHO2_02_FULL_40_12]OHC04930.1 MAG: 4-(cytidine 5'-diphospho)-2-C-methyl-D-erythritol kinase [Planctomycetes bacterium RIFCSPLOWO2_12_FULL_40_19]